MTRSLVFACLLLLAGCSPSPVQQPKGDKVRACLEELAAGGGDWITFSVTYDDSHGLHGGLTLTVHGDGRVDQRAIRFEAREPRPVSKPDLERLLALLREVKGWEQRIPERQAMPDESPIRLTVRCGTNEGKIWEWYNDMPENARISRVRDLMTQIAWQPKGGPVVIRKETR